MKSDTQTNLLQWQDQKLIAYEKALEFYADEDNYSYCGVIDINAGKRAREVIAKVKEKT